MKFLLTSTGFSNEHIVKAVEDLLQKKRSDISVGIIDEAYTVEGGDKSWVIAEMFNISKYFTKYVDIIDLNVLNLDLVKRRLAPCDIIYVVGGDVDYLMSVFNKYGISNTFPAFLGDRLYVGSSAGSMIIGHRAPKEVYEQLFGENVDYGVNKYLELIPHCIIPHFEETNFSDVNAASLTKLAKQYQCRLDGINNHQAITFNGSDIRHINGNPFTVDFSN